MKRILSILKNVYRKLLNFKYYIEYFSLPQKELEDNGILLISHELQTGGAETLLYHIARTYKEQGENICIVSLNNGVMFRKFYDLVPLRIMGTKRTLAFTKKLLKKKKYTRVICNTVLTGHLISELKLQGYKVISLVHEMEQAIKALYCENSCEIIAKNSDAVIFPSTYVYYSFLNCIHPVEMNYKIRNQGLFLTKELDEINKNNAKLYICKKYAIHQKCKIVLNVASGSLRKGFDLFLDLAYKFSERADILFIWVGGHTKKIWTDKLNQYNLNNFQNVLLPGYIDTPDELNRFYTAADILFLSSREDPFPSIVLEAFYAKTPAIAFNGCGGFIDIIKDNTTGALVPAYDLAAAGEILLNLIENPDKLVTMGENCRTIAEKNNFLEYCNFLLEQFTT